MAVIPKPYELMDLQDRETVSFRVLRWEPGEIPIKTQDEPDGKLVQSLRVHVPPEDKPVGLPYWDITSQTLQVQLLAMLRDPVQVKRRFTVTKHGVRPRARFTLEVA